MALVGFLNGHLLARIGGGPEGPAPVPEFDSGAYPGMAALAPRWADCGSVAEFGRMLDIVLDGIRSRAARPV